MSGGDAGGLVAAFGRRGVACGGYACGVWCAVDQVITKLSPGSEAEGDAITIRFRISPPLNVCNGRDGRETIEH